MKNYWKHSRIDGKKADNFINSIYPDYFQKMINQDIPIDKVFHGDQSSNPINPETATMPYFPIL